MVRPEAGAPDHGVRSEHFAGLGPRQAVACARDVTDPADPGRGQVPAPVADQRSPAAEQSTMQPPTGRRTEGEHVQETRHHDRHQDADQRRVEVERQLARMRPGQHGRHARPSKVDRDVRTRGPGTHHQDVAGHVGRRGVAAGVQLADRRVEPDRERRPRNPDQGAGGHHDLIGGESLGVGLDLERCAVVAEPADRLAVPDREPEMCRVRLQIVRDLVLGRIARGLDR